VTTTWLQFNLQLLQITGDPKYSQEMERTVYNHLFAAENPQTGCVSYYTALQGAKPYKCDQGFSCCLSSIPRGISLIPDLVWGKINGVFSILMAESGAVTDTIVAHDNSRITLKIESSTKFPLEGNVSYTIKPSVSKIFALNFRVPEWAKKYTAAVGKQIYRGVPGKFLKIERKWNTREVVNISFGIPVEVLSGGKSYPGRVALKRGPQVLAVDQYLNKDAGPLRDLICGKDNITLTDARKILPAEWGWKQAYSFRLKTPQKSAAVIFVPFSEAGQEGTEILTWIGSK